MSWLVMTVPSWSLWRAHLLQVQVNWLDILLREVKKTGSSWLARERRGATKRYLLELLKMADSLSCDALGGDFNQGIHQLDAIHKEFIVCRAAPPQMPVGTLGASGTGVTGWLLPPRSRLRPLRLRHHGQLGVHLLDLGVRRANTGCHWPNIVVHNVLSSRTRSDAAQQKKKEQKAAKAKAARTAAKRSYVTRGPFVPLTLGF